MILWWSMHLAEAEFTEIGRAYTDSLAKDPGEIKLVIITNRSGDDGNRRQGDLQQLACPDQTLVFTPSQNRCADLLPKKVFKP